MAPARRRGSVAFVVTPRPSGWVSDRVVPGGGRDLGDITDPIDREDLRTGDALVASGKHVRLFERWTSRDRSTYLAYDFGETPVKHQEYRWAGPGDLAYTPMRYRGA